MRAASISSCLLLAVLSLRAVAAAADAPSAAAGTVRRPNIVFFLCDDLGMGDIAALGSKQIRTPNIDRLFAQGTRLTRHWAGNAVCAEPLRAHDRQASGPRRGAE